MHSYRYDSTFLFRRNFVVRHFWLLTFKFFDYTPCELRVWCYADRASSPLPGNHETVFICASSYRCESLWITWLKWLRKLRRMSIDARLRSNGSILTFIAEWPSVYRFNRLAGTDHVQNRSGNACLVLTSCAQELHPLETRKTGCKVTHGTNMRIGKGRVTGELS